MKAWERMIAAENARKAAYFPVFNKEPGELTSQDCQLLVKLFHAWRYDRQDEIRARIGRTKEDLCETILEALLTIDLEEFGEILDNLGGDYLVQ